MSKPPQAPDSTRPPDESERATLERATHLLDLVHDCIISTDGQGVILTWNATAEQLYGYSAEEAIGQNVSMLYFAEDLWILEQQVLAPLATRDSLRVTVRSRNKSGAALHSDLRLRVIERDASGAPATLLGCSIDLTEHVRTEQQLLDRNAELEAVFRALPDLMFRIDAQGAIVDYRAGRVSDLYAPPEAFLGKRMDEVLPPDAAEALATASARALETGAVASAEYDLPMPGGIKHYEARLVPFPRGGVIAWVRDVTERAEQQRRMALLMDELDHRAKNALATTIALADQTALGSSDLAEFQVAFGHRIRALAGVHETLARAGWEGASVGAIAEAVLGPTTAPLGARFALSGATMPLSSAQAMPVALVLNELMTNALKHGALSGPRGRVRLGWHVEDQRLRLDWTEEDGPAVTTPLRTGTGIELIQGLVRHQLDGELELDAREDGLHVTMRLPLRSVRAAEPALEPIPAPPVPARRLEEAGVLIVEDDHLQARLMERLVRSVGGRVVGTASRAAEGLAIADRAHPDAALLDIHLGVGTSIELARVLHQRGCAVVFTTGYGSPKVIPAELAGLPVLHKPIERSRLEDTLRAAVERG